MALWNEPSVIMDREDPIKRFATIPREDSRVVVLISKDFPPAQSGGVATYNKDLAEALALEGHQVHVVTESTDIDRVDFEDGVWLHRRCVKEFPRDPEAVQMGVPPHIWNW